MWFFFAFLKCCKNDNSNFGNMKFMVGETCKYCISNTRMLYFPLSYFAWISNILLNGKSGENLFIFNVVLLNTFLTSLGVIAGTGPKLLAITGNHSFKFGKLFQL